MVDRDWLVVSCWLLVVSVAGGRGQVIGVDT